MGVKRAVKANTAQQRNLQSYFDEFIAQKRATHCAESTIKTYTESFDKFKTFYKDRKPQDINKAVIFEYINYLDKTGIRSVSVNHYLRDLRAFVNWCAGEGLYSRFVVPMVKEQEVIKETYTDKELKALLAKPQKTASFAEWRTWTIINWVLATGNRAETICNVCLEDLNFEYKEIVLRHTKNKKALQIPMGREISQILKDYIRMFRYNASGQDFLFCNIAGERLSTNALKLSIRAYNLKRGVSKTSIHALRHTFAKLWVMNKGDVFRLQKILGHSDLSVTRRYVEMFEEDLKEDFDLFNPLDNLKVSGGMKQIIQKAV